MDRTGWGVKLLRTGSIDNADAGQSGQWGSHALRFNILQGHAYISLYSQSLELFIAVIMRLPYIPDPPEFTEEADKAVLERIKERRGPKGLIALDRTLLHSPPVADGW